MNTLRTVLAELAALFVDDVPYAAAIVLWVAMCWAALPHLSDGAAWPACVLACGLVAILGAGAVLKARR